jgi:hypothetical protein
MSLSCWTIVADPLPRQVLLRALQLLGSADSVASSAYAVVRRITAGHPLLMMRYLPLLDSTLQYAVPFRFSLLTRLQSHA